MSGQELVQRRVEQPHRHRAGRPSPRGCPTKSARCSCRARVERGVFLVRRSRRGSCAARSAAGRRGTCARCGRGRCPRRRTRARASRVLGQVGVGAHLQRAELVGPAEDDAERPARLGRDDRHLADDDLAGRAVDRDDVALAAPIDAADRRTCRAVEVDLRAPRRRRSRACPCRARRPPRGSTSPPRDVRMPSAAIMPCRSSGDVSGRTRMTRSPVVVARLGVVGGEVHLADRGARRRVQALGEHGVLRLRVELRVQQLVELRGLHAQHRLALGR